jgi:hypothetical protein
MVRIDPRLDDLIEDASRARAIGRDRWADFCRLKRRLLGLVGWWADVEELATVEAYNVCYSRLLSAWITK